MPLVEMRGVEPLSESPLTQLSSWTVYLLEFPLGDDDKQSSLRSSPFIHDRGKGENPIHVHHYMTFSPKPWYSPEERVTHRSQPAERRSQCESVNSGSNYNSIVVV